MRYYISELEFSCNYIKENRRSVRSSSVADNSKCKNPCLVPVRRLRRPSRSMHFGDVPETNGWETRSDHVTRTALAARNNEAWGLGNEKGSITNRC